MSDLNRKIAELRGESDLWWCPRCKSNVPPSHVTYEETHDSPYCNNYVIDEKPYDSDILCAWELWEEMIASGEQFYLDANSTHSSVWHLNEGTGEREMLYQVSPYNAPKAIAGAYLKWREGR